MALMDQSRLESPTTTLGSATNFKGDLTFDTSLRIEGRYSGRIESPGVLHVAPGAVIEADIIVGAVTVAGTVVGNITASERLEIHDGGKVVGNIRTSSLKMADGVSFRGRCDMLNSGEGVDIFSSPPAKLKKILSRTHM